jgi:hypothetical protein
MKSKTTTQVYPSHEEYFAAFSAARAAIGGELADVRCIDWNGLVWNRKFSILFSRGGRRTHSRTVVADNLREAIQIALNGEATQHAKDLRRVGGSYSETLPTGERRIGYDARREVAAEYERQGELKALSAWERWIAPGHSIACNFNRDTLEPFGLAAYADAMQLPV